MFVYNVVWCFTFYISFTKHILTKECICKYYIYLNENQTIVYRLRLVSVCYIMYIATAVSMCVNQLYLGVYFV